MKKSSVRVVVPLLVFLLAITGILFALHYASEYTTESVEQEASVSGYYYPWDIWPVLMIDNQYYVLGPNADYIWDTFPPENLEYVADTIYVQEEVPIENYQLMSDYAISGELYIDLDDTEDRYFLLVTAESGRESYVSFIPLPDEELLVHYGLEFLITAQG